MEKQPFASSLLVLQRAQAKHLCFEHVRKEKAFQPAVMQVLILRIFFYSNIICFITVEVFTFPYMWKADYSFSCSYYLFLVLSKMC